MLFSQLSGYCPGRGTPYDWHIRAGRLHPEGVFFSFRFMKGQEFH